MSTTERVDAPWIVGRTLDVAIDFQLAPGPAGEVYREAHDEIVAGMKAALGPYATPEGIALDSSSWKITARNPN